jgi:iron complex outermembrane recepter protein
MGMHSAKRIVKLACGVSALVMPAIAFAQAAQTQNSTSNDSSISSSNDIIVTATRRETSIQDTPMAIDVVTGADVQKLNIFDTKELQNLSPGLELSNTTGRNNTASLRGIAFDPDGGTSPAVEVFYNEIPVNANTVFTAIYDLGQVEVLRGPQGLFRGRTSPAGALLFGTKRANFTEAEGYAQVTGTTQNAVNIQGGVSVPLISDKVAIRISGLYDKNAVAGVTTVTGRKSRNRTYSGRVSLSLRPWEGWTTYVMYQHLDAKLTPYILAFGPGNTVGANRTGPALSISDRKSVIEGPLEFRNKSDIVTVNSTLELGGVDVVANLGYQNTRLSQLRDQDIGNAIPNFSTIQDLYTSFKNYNAELRLESANSSRFTWSIAGDFHDNSNFVPLHTDQHSFSPTGVVGPTCILALGNACYERASVELTIKSRGWGLAGTVGYQLTDAIKFTGGIRYSNDKTVRDQLAVINPITGGGFPGFFFGSPAPFLPLCSSFGPDSAFIPGGLVNFYKFNPVGTSPFITVDPAGVCGLGTSSHVVSRNKLWSGGANLNWEINPDVNTYFSYGRTQRPGPPAVAVTAQVGQQYLQAKNETADGFEIGVKTNLLNRRMNLNVALFYQKFKNFLSYEPALFAIEPTGRVTTIAVPTNGDANVKGVEMQLGYRPTDTIDLGVNAAYAKSKYSSPVFCNIVDANGNPVLPPAPANITSGLPQTATCLGRPLSDSPKFTATVNGEVRFPIGAQVMPFIRGNANIRPAFTSARSNYRYPTDIRLDLFVGLRSEDQHWELTAFVKNVLNQDRLRAVSPSTFRLQSTAGTFIDSGYRTASINAPREFGVSGRFSF